MLSSLWMAAALSSHFCVMSKFVKDTPYPIIQFINEDIKQDWTQ